MTFFNLTSTEILLLVVLAVLVLGPRRLPHYAARLAQLVRQVRDLAEGAKGQIREEMGPAFDEIDWRQLDPRQYDPRRIVREALREPRPAPAGTGTGQSGTTTAPGAVASPGLPGRALSYDPSLPTPFDTEAT